MNPSDKAILEAACKALRKRQELIQSPDDVLYSQLDAAIYLIRDMIEEA